MDRLKLDGDRDPVGATIADYLEAWAGDDPTRRAVGRAIDAIAVAAGPIAFRLARAELPGDPARIVGNNTGGDLRKALDVAAHDHFLAALRAAGVQAVASEEAEEVADGTPDGLVSVAMDPIDGSSSIGVGALLGTLFALLPATGGTEFYRQPGREILAAGYVSYGHSVDMGFSTGNGVTIATFDPADGVFRIAAEHVMIPVRTAEIAFNAMVLRHLAPGIRSYFEDCFAGRDGPRCQDFNMRWLAAAVGELQRIMRRGGLFVYAADGRRGYSAGRLRLVYEANPIAFLCEQAGGAATNGVQRILDIVPEALHQHTPFVFGSAEEVATFGDYVARDAV